MNRKSVGSDAILLSCFSSMQAPYPSPRRKRQVSSIPPHFLFRPKPLRWTSVKFPVLPHGGATSGFGLPVATRPAVSGKSDTAAARGSRGWTGVFLLRLLERFQPLSDAFLLTLRVQFCKFLLVKLLDGELNGQERIQKTSVLLAPICNRICASSLAFTSAIC